MKIDKIELWVHDYILKNSTIRHFCYYLYQRILYFISPKIVKEGNISRISPDDECEYFFGYYDKCPWDDSGRYMLGMRVKTTYDEPDSDKEAQIVCFDLNNDNEMNIISTTRSWNVQQGCMLQWIDREHIIYNDFLEEKACAVIMNIRTHEKTIIDTPVYAVDAANNIALSLDFYRLHRLRPGYGYCNKEDNTKGDLCPNEPCIWKVDLKTNERIPLLTYKDLANFETRPEMKGAEHKVNHIMINPNGTRFMMLHRWFKDGVKYTRLLTCDINGKDLFNLSDDDYVSHCYWKNNEQIISYLNKITEGKGYYLLNDKSKEYYRLWKELITDGHPSLSSKGEYVVTDTYPNRKRIQSIFVAEGSRLMLAAQVFSPFKYGGNVRCDLHPRWNKDATEICFDGSFEGKRAIYTLDVSTLQCIDNTLSDSGVNLSIIIPCYNTGVIIEETFKSLEAQTRKDFEVIFVNDGSTDDTLERLNDFARRTTLDIQIINQRNQGVSVARNEGIQKANGRYVVFLDSDDILHKDYVYYMVGVAEKSTDSIIYCRLSRKLSVVRNYVPRIYKIVSQTDTQAASNLLYRMGEYAFCCYIYRKDILNRENILFEENTRFGEDREFNWKYISCFNKAVHIDMPLYGYRINNNSATRSRATWRKTDLLDSVKRTEYYLEEKQSPYAEKYKNYMFYRAMWATAKAFAVAGDKNLFQRLYREYDVKKCMRKLKADRSKLVAIASYMFCIHPLLFFVSIRMANYISCLKHMLKRSVR